ncbi:N-alpha-acetyltransferase 25, NatB auxiliary subunit, partial [Cladochytrium tenue]
DRLHLLEAAALLESALGKSKYNYQMKFLLVKILHVFGAYHRIAEVVASLEIKNIMNDSVSYVFSDDIEYVAPFDQALATFLRGLTIYSSNTRETPEMIIQAFKFASFSKILDFLDFEERLERSLQRAIFVRQSARVEILRRCGNLKSARDYVSQLDPNLFQIDDASIDSLRDNRDRSLNVSWRKGGVGFFDDVTGEATHKDRRQWLKAFGSTALLLRLLLLNDHSGTEILSMASSLKSQFDEYT